MKSFIAVLLIAFSVSAITNYTTPRTFVTRDTLRSLWLNNNFDTINAFTGRLVDTLNKRVVRFTPGTAHDSVLKYLRLDTLRSNPDIDSIQGNPFIDTVTAKSFTITGKANLDSIRSNPDVDSIKGNPFIDTITTRRIVPDSVIGPVRGNLTGNVTSSGTNSFDSIVVTKQVKSAGLNSSGAINATTGLFNSVLSADSIYSTKGIKGTNFTGNIIGNLTGYADSAIGAYRLTGGAVSGTTGLFSSTLSADSIYSTKGISLGGKVYADTIKGSLTIDSMMTTGGNYSLKSLYNLNGSFTSPLDTFILPSGYNSGNTFILCAKYYISPTSVFFSDSSTGFKFSVSNDTLIMGGKYSGNYYFLLAK